jgi:hypothetical protein
MGKNENDYSHTEIIRGESMDQLMAMRRFTRGGIREFYPRGGF